jgi:hypothetical protein
MSDRLTVEPGTLEFLMLQVFNACGKMFLL